MIHRLSHRVWFVGLTIMYIEIPAFIFIFFFRSPFGLLSVKRWNNNLNNKMNKLLSVKRSFIFELLSLVARKPVFGVSDQVRHKLGCATTEDGYRPELSDGIVLSV